MINQQEYQQRRRHLAQQLPQETVAIIWGGKEISRNGDSHYRFRQASDFYYLTGFNEPEAILLVMAGKIGESYLFNRPRNPQEEQWTGKRLGQDEACQQLGVTAAFPLDRFTAEFPRLLANKTAIYYAIGREKALEKHLQKALQTLKNQVRQGVKAPQTLTDSELLLGEMRLIKSESEIDLMRRAAKISVAAHKRAMKACRTLKFEYELEAEILHEITRQGCRSVAYDPIIGCGENACILHYTANNQPLRQGELVLIDAGGEFHNYAADITRTFPTNGRFSESQRLIYELVLKAQTAAIDCIKPGTPWNKMQETIVTVLTTGLCELGILQGDVESLIAKGAYKPFYMHNSGHWLGLDVHDSGTYKINNEWRLLEPGMVLTVEPGLYLRGPRHDIDERWWNIGVRIEDNILVTSEGHENLTADLPKTVAGIEALMSE